jgi:phospholipid/cholesterol/gamma-HCH transport system substrate-binding protein
LKELKVGLFALLGLASFIGMSLKITTSNSLLGSYFSYRAYINDANGINANGIVRVAGIEAGFVESISLSEDRAQLVIKVKKSLPVTQNTILKVKTVGFLGEKYLDISLGKPAKERLQEDSFIKVYENIGIEGVAEDASSVLRDIKEITTSLKAAINKDSRNLFSEIVDDVKATTSSLRKIVEGNQEKINALITNLESFSANLDYELDRGAEDSAISKIDPMLSNLRDASKDIKAIIADINAGKGTVGKLLRDEDVINKVDDTLTNVNQLVNRINNIEADIAIYTGVNTDNGTSTEFNLDLYPSAERFYRVGIVANDYGPEVMDERTTTTETNGATQVSNVKEKDEDAYKFSIQIGRIFQRFGFRAGLIETTGGFGVDYHFKTWIRSVSLEAFDFANDDGLNLRLYADFRIWNVIYTRLSAENIINDNRSATISFGLRFTDRDLASLIGAVAR